MCELAIIDPEEYRTQDILEASMNVYYAMQSSLGILVPRKVDGGFEYGIYRAVDPDVDFLRGFIEDQKDDAFRFIIHGRLATTGSVIEEHAHPLKIDCDECDVDYLLHNGIIRNHYYDRLDHEEEGHAYSTEVDSEVIAHDHGGVPESFDHGTLDYQHQPAYVLANDQRVFIHTNGNYSLNGDGCMAHTYRDFSPEIDGRRKRSVILEAN
jgi:predicted glutamine amidotransferase